MLWLTWRQHRSELAGAVVLLAAVAALLLATGIPMHDAYHTEGVATCIADPSSGQANCDQLLASFFQRHAALGEQLIWFTLLPVLAGMFVGAPLLGREFEHGTWKLAFTLTTSRSRWLTVKLAVVGLGVLVVAAAFTALFTWWRAPLDAIEGRITPPAFNLEGSTMAAAALFTFAAGTLAGVLLRRTVTAMAVTLASYIVVRVPIEIYARPRYQTPRLRITDPTTRPGRQPSTDWVLSQGWIDPSGSKLTDAEQTAILRQLFNSGASAEQYMVEHGLRHYMEYHPASSFWTFQLIETMLYVGLSAVLLVAAIGLLRRQTT